MPQERLKSPRARLFVALVLPEDVRAGLAAWGERELSDSALRPLRPETLHVTLCFLGYLPEKRIPEVAEVMSGLPAEPIPLRFEPVPVPKPPRRPRLFAIETVSPEATTRQAELSSRLEAARLYTPEKRPFWCHVTVAKVRPRRGERKPRPVERAPGALPGDLVRTFDSVRVALYRSNLRPTGAEYESLASLELPPGA